MLREAYGDTACSRSRVFEWYARFPDGREPVDDDHRSGHPSSVQTAENIGDVRNHLQKDNRITVRLLNETVGITKFTCHAILDEDMGKRN